MLNINEQELSIKWSKMDDEYNNFIEYKKKNSSKPLVFFGAGAAGSIFFYDMKNHGIEITCFCDNSKEKQNTVFCGLNVYSYNNLKEHFSEYDIVLSDGFIAEKLEQLKKAGEKNSIFCIEKTISYNIGLSYEFYNENIAAFKNTYEMLCDEKSKNDMEDFLRVSMTGNVNLFNSTERQYTYFDSSVFKLDDNEVYIDVGAYRGETILGFLDYCGNKYKKIVAIEADKANYEYLVESMESGKISNVNCYNYAAWNKPDTLEFDSWESALSRVISDDIVPPHKQIKVKKILVTAIDLDSLIYNENPTYIKMDIEGAELKALDGVSKSIIKFKPKLAISIYHKKEDLIEIPAYIKTLVPEYKFYLRNYGLQGGDTVLYATL